MLYSNHLKQIKLYTEEEIQLIYERELTRGRGCIDTIFLLQEEISLLAKRIRELEDRLKEE